MWPWRDWLVRALNANMPYDDFLTWQLAGDLLPEPSRASILATAFNRHHRQTNEGGSIEEEFRVEYVADRTNTFSTAFLGLTLECARCHSHKYDPITQKEYYQLFGFFNSIDESGLYSHFTNAVPTPTLALSTPEQDRATTAIEQEIRAAEARLARTRQECSPAFETWRRAPHREPVIGGLTGDFPLDAFAGGQIVNRAQPKEPGQTAENPELVPGHLGRAVRFSGENSITLPLGNFDRSEPFSLSLWINTPDVKDRAVIIHRSMAWTDAGSRGYQILIEDGKLSVALVHFWPGNAIGIQAQKPLALNQWVQVTVTYDGSSRASGLCLYVNGRREPIDIVRDHLTKSIRGGGNDHLTVGQRFRDRGFKNGSVDEIKVFDRALTPLEVAQLHDGHSLVDAVTAGHARASETSTEDLFTYYLGVVDQKYKDELNKLKALRQKQGAVVDPVAEIMVMKEMPQPRPTFLLKRGAYDAPAPERLEPGTPSSLPPFEKSWPRNRLGLGAGSPCRIIP